MDRFTNTLITQGKSNELFFTKMDLFAFPLCLRVFVVQACTVPALIIYSSYPRKYKIKCSNDFVTVACNIAYSFTEYFHRNACQFRSK